LKANSLFNRANGSTTLEAHTASFEANMACDEVFQETSKTSVMDQGQHNSRDQSCHPTSFETQQRQVNHLRGWKTPTSSVRDATLMVHFDTEQMQFAGRSQQFL